MFCPRQSWVNIYSQQFEVVDTAWNSYLFMWPPIWAETWDLLETWPWVTSDFRLAEAVMHLSILWQSDDIVCSEVQNHANNKCLCDGMRVAAAYRHLVHAAGKFCENHLKARGLRDMCTEKAPSYFQEGTANKKNSVPGLVQPHSQCMFSRDHTIYDCLTNSFYGRRAA